MSEIRSCSCTNQCPTCGACCQTACGHRGNAGFTITTPNTVWPGPPPWPNALIPPDPPPSEKRIREIVHDEIRAALRDFNWKRVLR